MGSMEINIPCGSPAASAAITAAATEEEGEEEDEEGDGGKAGRRLEEAVLGVAAEGWAGEEQRGRAVRSEVGLRLLRRLAGYCRWLPEAAADAHFEAARLLPQVGWQCRVECGRTVGRACGVWCRRELPVMSNTKLG